jgi:hypothetical protein
MRVRVELAPRPRRFGAVEFSMLLSPLPVRMPSALLPALLTFCGRLSMKSSVVA